MYSEEQLRAYPFFCRALQHDRCAALHDSLTGVVARPVILEFIHSLIAEKTEFSLMIVDLDNFKDINDHYGHSTGDEVLSGVAGAMKNHIGQNGVVGRLGGDEFLAVLFLGNEYGVIHDYFDTLFGEKAVFRRNYLVNGLQLYVTATIGSACFPQDAEDYDTLFAKMDKALYRGKSKGRNCYIIYVAAKHDALAIPQLANNSLYEAFRKMSEEFDGPGDAMTRMRRAAEPLRRHLHLDRLLWMNAGGEVVDADTGLPLGRVTGVEKLLEHGIYTATNFFELTLQSPELCLFLKDQALESVMISQVGAAGCRGAVFFCPEPHTMHRWQDEEKASAFVLCKMMEDALKKEQD